MKVQSKNHFQGSFGGTQVPEATICNAISSEKIRIHVTPVTNGRLGVAVITADILEMGYGKNEAEANVNHDENLDCLKGQARKANPRLNSTTMSPTK